MIGKLFAPGSAAPYRHPAVWVREPTDGPERLRIGAGTKTIELFLALAAPLREPLFLLVVMRARLFLAQAEEAKGDVASARALYQKIVDTWPPKTTGSRTSKKAAERLAALPKE